jgi:hypothetical protein
MKFALGVLVFTLAVAAAPAEARVASPPASPSCTVHVVQPDVQLLEEVMALEWENPEVATREWARLLLEGSPWPAYLHDEVLALIECESRYRPWAVGDEGLALGLLQIRVDAHPALANNFELLNGNENLVAGWIVYLASDRSFEPWACWEGK